MFQIPKNIWSVPPRIKLIVVVMATIFLTYVLLASDPWWLARFIPSETGRAIYRSIPDSGFHFTAYMCFSVILLWYGSKHRWRYVGGLMAFAVIHALTTEFLQQFVPDRTSDPRDLVANFLGIMVGSAVGMFVTSLRTRAVDELMPVLGLRPNMLPVTGENADVSAPVGLFVRRGPEDLKDLPTVRMLDFKFLGICIGVCFLSLGILHSLHGFQVRRNAVVLFEMGRAAEANGDRDAATDYLRRYVGMVPDDTNALADYGQMLDESGKDDLTARRVFNVFEDVLRREPTRDDIRRRQVEIAIQVGRTSDALAHLTVLRQSAPEDGELDFLAGRAHEDLAEYDEAAEAYEAAIAHAPKSILAYDRLARLWQERLDQPDEAAVLIQELVNRNSGNYESFLLKAKFLQEFGASDAAYVDITQALTMQPNDAEAIATAANIAYSRARNAMTSGARELGSRILAEAKQLLTRGIETHPDRIDFLLLVARQESHFGEVDEALSWIQKTLEVDASNINALLMLVDLTIEKGDFDRARTTLELLPRNPETDALQLYLQGRIYMAETDWKKASDQLQIARRFLTESRGMLERTDLALATCFLKQNDIKSRSAAYRRVLKVNPLSVPARLGMAQIYLESGKFAEAITEYRQLENLPQARLRLAKLLIQQNMKLPDVARDWREIEELLEDIEGQQVDPTQVILVRAELYAAQGRLDAARRVVTDARSVLTDRAEFWIALSKVAEATGDSMQSALWLAQSLELSGKSKQADAKYREAIRQNPKHNAPYILYIQFLKRDGRQQQANTLFQSFYKNRQLDKNPKLLAECHLALGDIRSAAVAYHEAIRKDSKDIISLRGLAEIYLRNNYVEEVVPVLKQLLKLQNDTGPHASWARRSLAVILASQGDYAGFEQANALLKQNLDDDRSADLRALAAVLSTRNTASSQSEAIQILERLGDRKQLLPRDRWLLGRLYQARGEWNKARPQYEAVLKSVDDNADYLGDYAELLISADWLDAADSAIANLRTIDANSFRTTALRIRLYTKRDDYANAIAVLKSHLGKPVASKSEQDDRYLRLASLMEELGFELLAESSSAERAAEFLQLAQQLYQRCSQDRPETLFALMGLYAKNGRVDDAFQICQQAWEQIPAEAAAQLSLALLSSVKTSNKQKLWVENHLARAARENPNATNLLICFADYCCMQERYDIAENLYRKVLENGFHPLAANNLAWLLARAKEETELAIELIEKVIRRYGPEPQFIDTRGSVYLARQNITTAITDFKTIIAESPSPTSYLHLAEAQSIAGKFEEARQSMRHAHEMGLNSELLHPLDLAAFERLKKTLKLDVAKPDSVAFGTSDD